jgi:hypothetical protein
LVGKVLKGKKPGNQKITALTVRLRVVEKAQTINSGRDGGGIAKVPRRNLRRNFDSFSPQAIQTEINQRDKTKLAAVCVSFNCLFILSAFL